MSDTGFNRKHHSISEVMEIQANAQHVGRLRFPLQIVLLSFSVLPKQKNEFHSHTFCVTSTKQAKLK